MDQSYGIMIPQASLLERSVSCKGVLEHYLDFADGNRMLERWGAESAKKSSLKPESRSSQHRWELPIDAGKQCEANHISEDLNEAPNGPRWDPLPLNPSRDILVVAVLFPHHKMSSGKESSWPGVQQSLPVSVA